jgi:hypothetical protein
MLRPAYAVEYDYLPAHQCDPSLQTKRIAGLFFSGQLNGTTGADYPASMYPNTTWAWHRPDGGKLMHPLRPGRTAAAMARQQSLVLPCAACTSCTRTRVLGPPAFALGEP